MGNIKINLLNIPFKSNWEKVMLVLGATILPIMGWFLVELLLISQEFDYTSFRHWNYLLISAYCVYSLVDFGLRYYEYKSSYLIIDGDVLVYRLGRKNKVERMTTHSILTAKVGSTKLELITENGRTHEIPLGQVLYHERKELEAILDKLPIRRVS